MYFNLTYPLDPCEKSAHWPSDLGVDGFEQ